MLRQRQNSYKMATQRYLQLLDSVLSLMKSISQNPSRFSVRVFRTPAASSYSYPTATKVDLGYRSVQQSEQQRYVPRYAYSSSIFSGPTKLWNPHINSNHNISHDARSRTNNYAIYPGALNDTYIYEQSACSEYDALSTATFSPAMSTDSTLTLRSPAAPERFFEERARRPATPAAPSSYAPSLHGSVAPHPSAMSRTTASIHHTYEPSVNTPSNRPSRVNSMQGRSTTPNRHPNPSASLNELTKVSPITAGYDGQLPIHIPEYATSTISELEVDHRDKIAKINAEYNAVSSSSSSSYYSNSNAAVAIEPIVRRMSISPPNQPSLDTFTRAASSQPLHPNLHFPSKPDDFNSAFNLNAAPSIFSTKEGSPPLVERVPSGVEFPSTNTLSSQFLPAQAQDSVYYSDSTHVPPNGPPTTNHTFNDGSASHSTRTTYATSQETTSLNEYRPLPVPPEAPRQRSTVERRPSVVGPRPDANVLKGASDVRLRSQTTREYSYDRRRDVSNSPPRGGSTLQPSSRELPNRATTNELNDHRPAPLTRHDPYVATPQHSPVEARSQIPHPTDTHKQPAAFVGPTETERSNDRIRTRSTSFSNSTRPNLPPANNLSQHPPSPQQYQASNNVRTSPPSKMQETYVHHSDYVEPYHPNVVRDQSIYNSQPAKPTSNRDNQFSHRQNLPVGQPSSKSGGGTPSYPTIDSRNATQEIPSSRSRLSYFELPAVPSGLPTRPHDKSSMPVKAGGSLSSNSNDQEYFPPEQPTQRRYSDGDQNPPPRPVESSGRSSAPLIRSVRWTENLICPSPVPASQRRKGWFNRRG